MFNLGLSTDNKYWGGADNISNYLPRLYEDLPNDVLNRAVIRNSGHNSIADVCELFIKMEQYKLSLIPDNETKIGFMMEAHGANEFSVDNIEVRVEAMERLQGCKYNLIILGGEFSNLPENGIGNLTRMSGIEHTLKSYKANPDDHRVRIYGNIHTIVLIVNVWTQPDQTTALLQIFLSMVETGEGLNSDITDMVAAVHKNSNIGKANQIYHAITNTPELAKTRTVNAINNVFKDMKNSRIDSIKGNIENINYRLNELQNDYSNYMSNKRNLLKELDRIKASPNIATDDIINYILKTKYIKKVSTATNGRGIALYYEAPMLYYDDDVIQHIRNSYEEEVQFIFDAFLERRYQLYTRCEVIFYPEDFRVNNMTIGNRNENNQYIGHPHIDRFGCFGNHGEAIQDWAETGDYIGAITQVTAAVLNLNFTDGTVVGELIDTLIDRADDLPTWYDTETGTLFTTNELRANLEQEDENGETEN